jgi:polysaccharide biosynthesis transport protein
LAEWKTMSSVPESMDLRGYLAVLRRHRLLIAAVTAYVLAIVLFWSFQRTPVYVSQTKVLIKPITLNPTLDQSLAGNDLINPENQQQLVESTTVASRADKLMRSPRTPQKLRKSVSSSVLPDSSVLAIQYSDTDPVAAQSGANAFAQAYLALREEQARAIVRDVSVAVERRSLDLQRQLQSLTATISGRTAASTAEVEDAQIQRQIVTGEIQQLRQHLATLFTVDITPGQIIEPANLPATPTSPKHPVDATGGLFLGLLAGVAVAIVRDRSQERLTGRDELARLLDRSVLATVPVTEAWRNRDEAFLVTVQEPESPSAEAYRALGMKVIVLASKHDARVVLVTSAAPGEGKSTTAANLAMVLAEAGKDVLLISADLRRPRLHDFFGLNNEAGLSTFLSDEAASLDVGGETANLYAWSVGQSLLLLPSGPPVPRALKMLESDAMRNMLKTQRDSLDFVILDSSPTLSSADPLGLVPMVDAVLFVADAKRTLATNVSTARDQFEQVGGMIIGAVLNRAAPEKGTAPYGGRRRPRFLRRRS